MEELLEINGYTFNQIPSNDIRKIYRSLEKHLPADELEKALDYMELIGSERERLIQFGRQTAKVFTEDIKIKRK